MNSLFQQKQRELVLAVSKVEELTRQLEMLKNGRIDGYHDNQSAVAELDRLYKELQVMGGQPVTLSSSRLKVGWVVSYLVAKKSRCSCSCQGCVTACMLRMEGWLCWVQGKEKKEHTLAVPFLSAKFGD